MMALKVSLATVTLLISILYFPMSLAVDKCLYVSSYHQGYAWSDGVEQGLRGELEGACEIHQIDMDTKRNKDKDFVQQAANEVRLFIEQWQPNVVITSDDNAAKYVIQQYYRDAEIPFVFSGVNWTVKEYGFPYDNVTGIIEVAPLKTMLSQAADYANSSQAVYLGADTLTEKKNLKRVSDVAQKLGIALEGVLVSTAKQWKQAYVKAQQSGFIVMGSYSGIDNWDKNLLSQFSVKHANKLVVTSHQWMMPFSTLGYTKIPQEHGSWAAKAAKEILQGTLPSEIPIVANRKWDIWVHTEHLQSTGIKIPRKLIRKAKKLTP